VEATVKVDVLNKTLGLEKDTAEMGVVGCELDSGETLEKGPGLERDVNEVECEAVGEAVERRDRFAQDLQSPNEASSGWARRDQPSLDMPGKIRSGHVAVNL
jgi:hypothetical protein